MFGSCSLRPFAFQLIFYCRGAYAPPNLQSFIVPQTKWDKIKWKSGAWGQWLVFTCLVMPPCCYLHVCMSEPLLFMYQTECESSQCHFNTEREEKHHFFPCIWAALLVNDNLCLFPSRRHRSRVTRTSSKGCELRWSVPEFSPPAQLRPRSPGCHLVFIAPSLWNPTGMDCPDWTTSRPTLQPLPLRSTF